MILFLKRQKLNSIITRLQSKIDTIFTSTKKMNVMIDRFEECLRNAERILEKEVVINNGKVIEQYACLSCRKAINPMARNIESIQPIGHTKHLPCFICKCITEQRKVR